MRVRRSSTGRPCRRGCAPTCGSTIVADQRGSATGCAVPSACATALTCAKYAISPGPARYAAVGRIARSTTGRSSTLGRGGRPARGRLPVIVRRRRTPSRTPKTSDSPFTCVTCGWKPAARIRSRAPRARGRSPMPVRARRSSPRAPPSPPPDATRRAPRCPAARARCAAAARTRRRRCAHGSYAARTASSTAGSTAAPRRALEPREQRPHVAERRVAQPLPLHRGIGAQQLLHFAIVRHERDRRLREVRVVRGGPEHRRHRSPLDSSSASAKASALSALLQRHRAAEQSGLLPRRDDDAVAARAPREALGRGADAANAGASACTSRSSRTPGARHSRAPSTPPRPRAPPDTKWRAASRDRAGGETASRQAGATSTRGPVMPRSSLVIRLPAHDGAGAIQLFGEHEAREFVRQRPRRERERLLRGASAPASRGRRRRR